MLAGSSQGSELNALAVKTSSLSKDYDELRDRSFWHWRLLSHVRLAFITVTLIRYIDD